MAVWRGMGGSWASWSLVVGGSALVAAGIVLPFLPQTAEWFLVEDAFEDPGLLLVALGALAGRQRLWPLGCVGALAVLAVDLGWRAGGSGPGMHVAWMAGAALLAVWACWPMRGAGVPLAVAQVALGLATASWLVHGSFLASGAGLPSTIVAGAALLFTMGIAVALRGFALRWSFSV